MAVVVAAGDPDGLVALVQLNIDLPVRHPFDAPGVFRFLAARAIEGVEVADLSRPGRLQYARTLRLPHGPAALEVVATADAGGYWTLQLGLELSSSADRSPAVVRVQRMLDLDADPLAIDSALAGDPALAPLVQRTPGIRAPGTVDAHELIVRAMVGQQISVARARAHLGRLTAEIGPTYVSAIGGLHKLFPTAAQIATSLPEPAPDEPPDPDRPLRLPGQSVRAIRDIMRALADGELDVNAGADPEAMHAQLIARPRIGPWTAAYIAMRVLGDPDAWLFGDVALVAGAKAIGVLEDNLRPATAHRLLADRASAWAPWRSYAAMHLWQAAAAASRR